MDSDRGKHIVDLWLPSAHVHTCRKGSKMQTQQWLATKMRTI